ncbi:hypothetical protein [Microcoleus sp. FACHB-68]|nr:hypothetical protein [Microcoleus sp. FACHB-68]
MFFIGWQEFNCCWECGLNGRVEMSALPEKAKKVPALANESHARSIVPA